MQRYRDIVFAFSRYGFGYIAVELGLYDLLSLPKRVFTKDKAKVPAHTTGERVRLFLQELGPTFIKLGQFASTRSDILPEDIIHELEKLQDDVPPFSSAEAMSIVEEELGDNVESLFKEFDETPLAAASIGQVHRGVLISGEPIAIKVQRPDIRDKIFADLDILYDLANLAENQLEWASRYQVKNIIKEFSRSLRAELDYTNEGLNAEKIANQFLDDSRVRIPEIYWEFSTKKVLTMEFIHGTKLNDEDELLDKGINHDVFAERLVDTMFHQIFIDGFFHGDPHPGNIMALPGEEVVLIDFGSVGRLSPEMKHHLSSFVIALMRQNTDRLIKAIDRMGVIPQDVDMKQLRADVDLLREKYYDVPLSQVSLGEAVNDLFTVTYYHHIQLPSDLALLGRTLLTIEAIVVRLDPELSIVKMAEPFGKQLIKERYHPKKIAENIIAEVEQYTEIVSDLPDTIKELRSVIKKGKVRFELNIPGLNQTLKKLDQISNRLSFSIVLLSFSIIMTGLIIGSAIAGQSTMLWNIPVIEVGFVVATLMFLWILFGIFRSGRF
ncbi:AarF/ABC1/UbiB kinase family protein [Virgibacillus sp. MSJ-26]|uniref:ABC1 kinase family protein n=1 Tax=Virgibacillus sp. MSJ-26 TaxID=2841522 RepID=UPI001C11885F|nr:AarF/ABC1/UbiB kinase family protein [Virgibacillus sp. MSJ-26]MBU5467157.1 AarF/ABC1/UbiB kinase family protein [Virgibacillus sp. MSJ-26]